MQLYISGSLFGGSLVLCIHVDIDDGDQIFIPVETLLLSSGTIADCIEETITATIESFGDEFIQDRKDVAQEMPKLLIPALNLLIYLCTQSDMMLKGTVATPLRATPKKVKSGLKFFPPNQTQIWDIGTRMGSAIRAAMVREKSEAEKGQHASPRPHIRRAHWHSFRIGARKLADGTEIGAHDRGLKVKWLPPISVNTEDYDALPASIRKVE